MRSDVKLRTCEISTLMAQLDAAYARRDLTVAQIVLDAIYARFDATTAKSLDGATA